MNRRLFLILVRANAMLFAPSSALGLAMADATSAPKCAARMQDAVPHAVPAAVPTAPPLESLGPREDRFTIRLAGRVVGALRVELVRDGSLLRTTNDLRMQSRDGGAAVGQAIDVQSTSLWEEKVDGTPMRLVTTTTKEGFLERTEWTFGATTIAVVRTTKDGEVRSKVPMPGGGWHPPQALERAFQAELVAGKKVIEQQVLDASQHLRVLRVRSEWIGVDTVVRGGVVIPVSVWRTTMPDGAGTSVKFVDRDGRLAFSMTNVGVGILETALAGNDPAKPTPTPERAIAPARPMESLASSSRAVYRIRAKDGELPLLPTCGMQRVAVDEDRRAARVTVDVASTTPATACELFEIQLRADAPSIDALPREVAELASKAMRTAEGISSAEFAASARTVVHEHLAARSVAGESPASGAPTAASAQPAPTCALLLCSVLQLNHIPARVVGGLRLADAAENGQAGRGAVFVWHCWTQALIDGRWVDLDASGREGHSAARLATSVTRTSVGVQTTDLSDLLAVPSNLEIDLLEDE